MKQRLTGTAALLGIAALILGMPWLLLNASTAVSLRFDLTTPDGWWQAISTPDDGSLLTWILIVLGTIAWAILTIAILVEITCRARQITVPHLRGLGVPQAIARGLVAAAMSAVLTTNVVSAGTMPALATPGPLPADSGGTPRPRTAAPAANPAAGRLDQRTSADTYVVRKGDTLWDIADGKLGNPRAYPEIFKASRRTVQPDGRHLVDPDLIYPGWKLTIPGDDPPEKPTPNRSQEPAARNHVIPPTSAPPTTPSATSEESAAAASTAQPGTARPSADADGQPADEAAPPWMLAGFTGAGALLAGGTWLWLRRRRAAQYRFRRPGRTITVPDEPGLAVVEKTLMHQGDLTSDLVDRIAQTTQRLAARFHSDGLAIPTLLGIDVAYEHLTLRFADPVELNEPWTPGENKCEWRIATETEPNLIGPWDEENEPVWPTLVTLGQDARGWRLLNLETLGVINLTGNQTNAEDLVRSWIAELSVAHWGRDLEITGGDYVDGLTAVAGHRQRKRPPDTAAADLIERTQGNDHWLAKFDLAGIDTARAAQSGPELWPPRVLVATDDLGRLDELADAVTSHLGRTGITIIRLGGAAVPPAGTEIRLTDTGRVQVPALGLDLVATGLTADEAEGCAVLKNAADDITDAPMPDAAESGADWQRHCDAAGHLHTDLVIPRGTATFDALSATSLLPEPDPIYVAETANTVEDLAELAPLIPASTTTVVNEDDPTLDEDLTEWRADTSDRPRLSVLGPVRLRLGRGGQASVGAKRVAFYTEIAAYLATRPHGATTDELIEALGLTADRVRVDLHTLRARLGINPTTDRYFVPKASDSAEAHQRGEGIYLIEDMLCDADLFRRLRLRGEAAGANGVDDLANALRLVTGAPYEQLRRRGGLWLADSRDDQHLLVAIIDVAHLLTTHAVAAGDLRRARAAAELAHAIAPAEVTPQLDLAVIAEHEGDRAAAGVTVGRASDWLDGTGEGPMDLGERADTIVRAHRRLERGDH